MKKFAILISIILITLTVLPACVLDIPPEGRYMFYGSKIDGKEIAYKSKAWNEFKNDNIVLSEDKTFIITTVRSFISGKYEYDFDNKQKLKFFDDSGNEFFLYGEDYVCKLQNGMIIFEGIGEKSQSYIKYRKT